LLDRHV